ncbi:MAG: DUF3795 domain-containing protein [Firmicutes bacterium]|nr:DUF3795 domain-containing protein [Bacillota bacterium]
MKEYTRDYPRFSLCGLNCGLCPRYHADGVSRCPGCGGPDFSRKHPSCPVITCNKRHDNVEYCFQCSSYPCPRYSQPSDKDSFISYRNVISDFQRADQQGIDSYKKELDEKVAILEYLIRDCNDGRRKGFYCLALNLLKLSDVKDALEEVDRGTSGRDTDVKEKAKRIVSALEARADQAGIELRLRK